MKRVALEPAYVLHRRPYRETSFLVELFTQQHGRLAVVARGVRKARSATQGLLQPFTPLLVSWSGKGELMTLTDVELGGEAIPLQGECLFAGFYLNELLIGLLQKWDAHPQLYTFYQATLVALQKTPTLEQKSLRIFEKYLLDELGYALFPAVGSEDLFELDKYYRFVPEHGFVISELGEEAKGGAYIFLGKSLIAIASNDWQDEVCLQDAKRLMRLVLMPLLNGRPLHTRKLFMSLPVGG